MRTHALPAARCDFRTLCLAFASLLLAAASSAYSQEVSVGGGTTAFSDTSVQISGGTFTVPDGSATFIGGFIFTTGDFNKNGGGLLNLALDVVVNGKSSVTSGVLLANGTFQADGGLNVLPGAFLGGSGVINGNVINNGTLPGTLTINGNILNNGTLAPGNSPGTLTINGNYTQGSSGTFALEIAGPTVLDQLNVTGTASLSGTLAVQNTGAAFAYGQQYPFLQAASINGGFDQITMPSPGLYRARFLISGGTGSLLIAPTSYTLVAQTQNQRNVARALDAYISAVTGDRAAVSLALDQLTSAQYPSAFDAISPAQYENLASTSIEQANAFSQILQQRFASVRLTGGRGFTAQGLNSPLPGESGKNVRDPKDILVPAPDNNWGAWAQGDGFFGTFSSLASVPNSRFSSGGVTAGLDYRFPVGLTLGAFSGYQGLYSNYDNGGNMNINTVNFGLYGSYEAKNGLYANLIVNGGYSNYRVRRSITFSTIDRDANSSPSGGLFSTTADLGYDWKIGRLTITPTIAGQFTYVGVAPFTETGADSLNLRVNEQAANSLRTSLGARAAYTVPLSAKVELIPQVSLLWQHEFLEDSRNIGASLDGGAGPGFEYLTTAPGRDAAYAGAGFTLRLGENLGLNAYYNASFGREDFLSHMISGGVNFSF